MPGQLFPRRLAVLNEDLDEGALFPRPFPGERFLAGGDPDDKVAHAPRLTRLHHHVPGQVIALVEHAQSDDAVLVRRTDALPLGGLRRAGLCAGDRLGNLGLFGFGFGPIATTAGQRQEAPRQREG